jgi:hypothetical protein
MILQLDLPLHLPYHPFLELASLPYLISHSLQFFSCLLTFFSSQPLQISSFHHLLISFYQARPIYPSFVSALIPFELWTHLASSILQPSFSQQAPSFCQKDQDLSFLLCCCFDYFTANLYCRFASLSLDLSCQQWRDEVEF